MSYATKHTLVPVRFAGTGKKWMCLEHGPSCVFSKRANKETLLFKLYELVVDIVDTASSPDPKEKRRLPGEWRNALVKILNEIEEKT